MFLKTKFYVQRLGDFLCLCSKSDVVIILDDLTNARVDSDYYAQEDVIGKEWSGKL
jgi:hypothetical protein